MLAPIGYANSEYRTERDTLTKIIAYGAAGNGPSYFIAQTKSGQTIQYGNSTDSRILATGKTTAMVWNANRITDTVSNYLTITYTQNTTTGEYYPQRIDYAGNSTQGTSPSSSVQFLYATRSDTFTGYVAGSTITNTQRMTNIQVFEGTTSIRDYRLTYDSNQANTMTKRSRLTALTECDSNMSTANCLPATTMSWSSDGTGFNGASIGSGIPSDSNNTVQAIDVDGDGKTDLAYCTSNSDTWKIAFSNGGGFNAAVNTGVPCTGYQQAKAIDIDSDGKMDLLVPYANAQWYVLRSTGTTFAAPVSTGLPDAGKSYFPQVFDVNGDGRSDFIQNYNYAYHISFNSATGLSAETGSGPNFDTSSAAPFDYNGDGKTDVLIGDGAGSWHVLVSNGINLVDAGSIGTPSYPRVSDVNGDGRADLVYVGPYSGSSYGSWRFRLNTGAGFSATVIDSGLYYGASYAWPCDYNGDGKTDLLIAKPAFTSTWHVHQSTGAGFVNIDTGIPNTGYANHPQIIDLNGDGQPDLLYYYNGWNVRPHKTGYPDQLTTITNGLGATTTITYKPLTNSAGTIYTKGTGAIFPQQDFQGPMYVVAQYTTSDGVGGAYPITYSYQGARVDLQGRGFVGFGSITQMDTRTGIATTTAYGRVWPYVGMVKSISKTLNGATLSSTVNTFAYTQFGTSNVSYYFPFISKTVNTTYELPGGGTPVTTVTTNNYYYGQCYGVDDRYCDLSTISVVSTAGSNTFTKTTNNTYDYSGIASWVLGRLTNAQVTSTLPSGASLTRESAFTYYTGSGLLWTEVVEPNQNVGGVTNMTQTTTYTYDGFGNKTGATVSGADGVSRPASAANNASPTGAPYAYTAGRFETNLTNAALQGESRVYDARFGTVATLTGPNNLSTNWQYDSFGRKSTETRADGTTTTWTYSLCGTCPTNAKYYVTQTTSGAPTVTVYYDLLDRELRTQTVGYNGALIYKDTIYNNLGQVAKVSRPYYSSEVPYWTYFSYDALGRATSQSLPTQATSAGTLLATTAYNGLTTVITQYRDGTALTTTQVKDAIGELVSVTDANSNTTSYQYDPFGNLTKVTDPALNVTTMTYDLRGRKLTMTDPDMGYWQYIYDSVGELIRQIDAKSRAVFMTYDSLGRMRSRIEAEGTTTWTYDDTTVSGPAAKGKLSKVTWPGGDSRTFVYDDKGRPNTETTTLSGTAYMLRTTYDSNSRIDILIYPSGFSVRNNYNVYGYLSSITRADTGFAYWTAPQYTAAGQVSAFTLGNNLTTVNKYNDGTGLLEGISTGVGLSGSATQYLTYQYDTLGNLKQRQDGNQTLTETFSYDKLNRLQQYYVNANGSITANKSVAYDSLGNITSKSDVGTYTYDPLHIHAVKTAGTGSYTYDANGNQKNGPNGRSINYTSFNQPLSITQGGKTNTFTYDGDHQRITETSSDGTTITLHPRIDLGGHYEEVHKTDGTVEYKNYIYAGKEVIAVRTMRSTGVNDLRYFHKDHLGSIDTITNETGGIVERLSYDAWGKRRNGNWTDATTAITSLTHHGFTGHEMLDDVGLINMNGRVYDPTLGRFISADPTVQSPGNPQTLNRYAYANNNPLTYVDPSGYSFLGIDWGHLWKSIIRPILAIAAMVFIPQMSWYFGPWAGFVGGFTGGLLASGGDLKAGLIGGVTAGAFGMLHNMPTGGFMNDLTKVIAHGITGGISSVLQGAKFKSGFMSAGFTELASVNGAFNSFGDPSETSVRVENAIAAAVVGGTASVIGGGKFENGVVTGAFSRLFNDAAHEIINGASAIASARPLTADERNLYAPYFKAEVLDSVRVYDGKVPWWLRSDMDGITLGNNIYILSGAYVPDTAVGVEFLGHEITHVGQYANGMTYAGYVWASRNGYSNNPYETEAYANGAKIRNDFCVASPTKSGC